MVVYWFEKKKEIEMALSSTIVSNNGFIVQLMEEKNQNIHVVFVQ